MGNESLLDFLNTRLVQNREPVELLPDFGAFLSWFRAADVLNSQELTRLWRQWHETPKAEGITESMRELREDPGRKSWLGSRALVIRRATIDELNRLMLRHAMSTRLIAHGRAYSSEVSV